MDTLQHKKFAKTLPGKPGVYLMKDSSGRIIYAGKANNLKNRVSSYFSESRESVKTQAMVKNIASIEYTVTNSESEALLLESNVIKEYKPRYNIIFRDDKSYPYLYLSSDQTFPRLSFYRGARSGQGRYFGPYPSAGASRKTLNIVQKLFRLRHCDDTFFKHRSRPCLQYQINRCSGPCVGLIDKPDYAEDIRLAELFLEGKNERVLSALTRQMTAASETLEYEKAANIRDQIALLRSFQESQHIISDRGEADFIACALEGGQACIQVFIVRGGRNLGSKTFYPKLKIASEPEEILAAFLIQYYLNDSKNVDIPPNLYLSHKPEDLDLFKGLIASRKNGKSIKINTRTKGEKAKVIKMALENASLSLLQKFSRKQKYAEQFERLGKLLNLDEAIHRIECFDISHHGGKTTTGSCVVFGREGPLKSDYRKFNVNDVIPGDDYQAMDQVIKRHYTRLIKNEGRLPDLILLDGGKGQLAKAHRALSELQLDNSLLLLGIAKGPGRKPGLEKLYATANRNPIKLQDDSPVLHLLQEIRDEAHRFAITSHRSKSKKQLTKSLLDNIPGIGNKRKQRLILHFGGLQGVKSAGIDDIARVPGISKSLAERIYSGLHS